MEDEKDEVKKLFDEKKEEDIEMSRTRRFLIRISEIIERNLLVIMLVGAVLLGASVPQFGNAVNTKAINYVLVSVMFLYCGLYLQTSAMKEAVKSYRAWSWGVLMVLFVSSLVAGELTMLMPLDRAPVGNRTSNSTSPFRTGLLVYFVAPCTVTSGLMLVIQLGGNFALAVLITAVTNVAGIFTSPFLLKWMLSRHHVQIHLDLPSIFIKLSLTLLLPLIVGKILQLVRIVQNFTCKQRVKRVFSVVNITCLALIITITVAASARASLKSLSALNFLIIIGWSLLMHIMFLVLNGVACFVLRIELSETKCLLMLCSHKTAAVSVAMLTFLPHQFGDKGLMTVAIVLAHISIIVCDSLIISIWLYVEKRRTHRYERIL